MDVRLALASLLLLSVVATAQEKKPPAPDAKPAVTAPLQLPGGQIPVGQNPGKPATQDPDRPAPKPVDVIGDLTKEKERLQAEIEYAKNRAKNANAVLAQKLAQRGQTFKAIDAGTSVSAPATTAPVMKKARIAAGKDFDGQAQDTMALVNGKPIRQGQFDELMTYLRSSPASGKDDNLRAQRVLFDLIRTTAVVAALPENGAEGQIGDVLGQLQSGKSAADLAKSVGTVQGAKEDGSIEITRNSYLGTRLEATAFTLQPGQPSRPFHTPQGIAIVVVDSVEKGSTPELDKVKAHVVMVPWHSDPAKLQQIQAAPTTGQVDIVVRDQAVLDMLPALYKPVPTHVAGEGAVAEAADNELAAMTETLKRIDEALAKLAKETGEEAQKTAAQLKQQRAEVEKALQEMQDRLKHDDAAKAVEGAPVKIDAPTKAPAPDKKGADQPAPKKQ